MGIAGSRLHGETVAFGELEVGLALPGRVRLGGAAYLLPGPVDVGTLALRRLDMTFGYGGLFVEIFRPALLFDGRWSARLFAGAGNADVREASTSLRLDSDNVVVLEPGVGLEAPLTGRLAAALAVSWRWVGGVEDLRGVEGSDLRGPSLRLGLRFAPL